VTTKVYAVGYSGRTVEWLRSVVESLGATVLDVRFNAMARAPEWRGYSLKKTLAGRYEHMKCLGNVNYKNGGEIQIVDLAQGVERILASETPVILLCVCGDATTCHRSVIAAALAEHGIIVEELDQPVKKDPRMIQPDLL
jgi:uncharacterized protein (DUF488 family)